MISLSQLTICKFHISPDADAQYHTRYNLLECVGTHIRLSHCRNSVAFYAYIFTIIANFLHTLCEHPSQSINWMFICWENTISYRILILCCYDNIMVMVLVRFIFMFYIIYEHRISAKAEYVYQGPPPPPPVNIFWFFSYKIYNPWNKSSMGPCLSRI